jgi:DNA-binding MarR family transcriptional regulator
MGSIYLDNHLNEYNLSHNYSTYLLHICKTEGVRQDHLSDHLRVNRSTTKRAIDHLVSHGYVTREVYEQDKRKYCLYPTKKAYDILDEIRRLKKEWDDIITEDLSEEEKTLVYKINEKMLKTSKKYVKENLQNK